MFKFIEDAWPLKSMPKAKLLAVFLNPAIALDPVFRMKTYCDGKTLFFVFKEITIEVVSELSDMEHKAKMDMIKKKEKDKRRRDKTRDKEGTRKDATYCTVSGVNIHVYVTRSSGERQKRPEGLVDQVETKQRTAY
jgi:hypothetical protein